MNLLANRSNLVAKLWLLTVVAKLSYLYKNQKVALAVEVFFSVTNRGEGCREG